MEDKKINHFRNFGRGIIAAFAFGFLALAFGTPGFFVGVFSLVFVALPMTIVWAIMRVVSANKVTADDVAVAEKESAEEDASEAQPKSDTSSPEANQTIEEQVKEKRFLGYFHLVAGCIVVIVAVTQLVILQSAGMWTQMFWVPFWWIILFCSSVSFLLSAGSFRKARAIAQVFVPDKKNEGEKDS